MDAENEEDRFIDKGVKRRSTTVNEDWLKRAIEQKNAHLSVAVAYSELLVFDQLDRRLVAETKSN